ncbi:hypothetical protein CYLTODRAFT_344506 [Cylindrobasidium torrendii FP15055 ss-10]|uniref:Uncharacterized protein n=1 Tax=Cylindrobasidium torrendii FP15055 ss-10 TaxID=1314674 RepID=A0A0D7BPQ3_9AGAR|nr:hypothetical protein CYLTODRAFT_344506 [Cylindrobasidium torrendii FP15055 ss-10]
MLSTFNRSSAAGLPAGGGSLWNRFARSKKPEPDTPAPPPQQTLARQRLLTLAMGDMETIRVLPNTYAELEAVARDWAKPPPDADFNLRIPIDYASLNAARFVNSPYIYLTGEESFQIAVMGVHGTRVEIVSDAPPPPDEPPAPPPPPVTEMEGLFNLELFPGQPQVQLETDITSDGSDMARMEDGTTVDGTFWGRLDIVHDGDKHTIDFNGTRVLGDLVPSDLTIDHKLISKLTVAAKPSMAKCSLVLLTPDTQYCDVVLTFSPLWKLGNTWPPAEGIGENKVKYFLRAYPGGALEHFVSEMVVTALYYEAIPDASMAEPSDYVSPRNGFAMSYRDFVPHLMNVLDQLGMSPYARTTFINNNLQSFAQHKNIAYRFLAPAKIAAAIDITVTTEPCIFLRLFLIFRGMSDDDVGIFAGAGEKEANAVNWREVVNWTEESKDNTMFRVLETSVLEIT